MNVDRLFSERPYIFPHPIPPIEDRATISIGEQVKVLVGIREDERLPKGRWVIVEGRTNESELPRFMGKSLETYGDGLVFEFHPEQVYRIEPRLFTLWGARGIPRALRGQASNDLAIHPPLDHHENGLSECPEIILRFRANGWLEAKAHYQTLTKENPTWPSLDELI